MPIESATYINGLVATNPASSDPLGQGDNHLRLIKSVLKNTFPNISAAVTATAEQLNALTGLSASTAELNILSGATVTTAELNYLSGVTSALQAQIDAKLAAASYTAADVLAKLLTVDGVDSGLDADLLDGEHGAFYRDASNINSGAVPIAHLPVANEAQAQAGVASDVLMTPERVNQAIQALAVPTVPALTAGDVARWRIPDEFTTTSTSYTPIHRFKVRASGSMRIKVQIKNPNASYYTYVRIMKNGTQAAELSELGIGGEAESYATHSSDIVVADGDVFEIQVRVNAGTGYFRNLEIATTTGTPDFYPRDLCFLV